MKKILKFTAGFLFAFCLAVSAVNSIEVSASTVNDVIDCARSLGMPESEIQGYISDYGNREWTSKDCDSAINYLKENYKPENPEKENQAVIADPVENDIPDAEENIVNTAGFGVTIEKTGVSRAVPVFAGGGLVLMSAAGIVLILRKEII